MRPIIDPVPLLAILVTLFLGILTFFQVRQRLAFDRETRRREAADKIDEKRRTEEDARRKDEKNAITLVVDNYEAIVEEVSGFNKRNREMFDQVQKLQKATIDCENRCAELARQVAELKRHLEEWKALNLRWQTFTGIGVPP